MQRPSAFPAERQTDQRYVQDIFRPHVLPLMAGLPARTFQSFPRNASARLQHFPARSPDLSPIKHLRDQPGHQLRQPTTVCRIHWSSCNISGQMCCRMPNSIPACILTRGDQTDDYCLHSIGNVPQETSPFTLIPYIIPFTHRKIQLNSSLGRYMFRP